MIENFNYIGSLLSERYVLPKHLGISSRQVSYWKEKIVLPFFAKEKHARMNIPEAVWLFVVDQLNGMGIDSTRLAGLAKDVWDKPRHEDFLEKKLETFLSRKDRLVTSEVKDKVKQIASDELLLTELRKEYNPFTDVVVDSILLNKNPMSMFYFPTTGEHHFSSGDKQLPIKLLSLMDSVPFICIPIMPMIKKIVAIEFEYVKKDLVYLDEIEKQIKDLVIFKAPKHIEIMVDDDIIKPLIIREEHKRAEQLAAFFLNNKLPKNARLLIEPRSQDNYKITILTK